MSGDIPMIHSYEEQHGDQGHNTGDVRQVFEAGWRAQQRNVAEYEVPQVVTLDEAWAEFVKAADVRAILSHPAPSGWQQRIAESRLALAVEAERHLASIWTSLPLGAQANAMRLNPAGLDPVYRALRELGGQNAVDALPPEHAKEVKHER